MTRFHHIAAALILVTGSAVAAPHTLVIANCVYRHESTAGTVETYVHTCVNSDNVEEPIAIDCRSGKFARHLSENFIIPGRSSGRVAGWQEWVSPAPDDISVHYILLVLVICASTSR
jgi:hypothetical protein